MVGWGRGRGRGWGQAALWPLPSPPHHRPSGTQAGTQRQLQPLATRRPTSRSCSACWTPPSTWTPSRSSRSCRRPGLRARARPRFSLKTCASALPAPVSAPHCARRSLASETGRRPLPRLAVRAALTSAWQRPSWEPQGERSRSPAGGGGRPLTPGPRRGAAGSLAWRGGAAGCVVTERRSGPVARTQLWAGLGGVLPSGPLCSGQPPAQSSFLGPFHTMETPEHSLCCAKSQSGRDRRDR